MEVDGVVSKLSIELIYEVIIFALYFVENWK